MSKIRHFFRRITLFSSRTPIGKVLYFIWRRVFYPVFKPNARTWLGLFVLLLGFGAYIRFWAAPLSAGVDVPQFWGFAKVFEQYGLDFYKYADATLDIFPVKGWGYVYPPVWLLILRLSLFFAPESQATEKMVTEDWRWAEKTPIIAADLAIGCLLFFAMPGSRLKKLFFAGLWLLHPTAWYNSAVFGQFDAVAAFLLLAAVILLEKNHDRWAFTIAALAVLTKQHVFIPVVLMAAAGIKKLGWRRLGQDAAIFTGVVLVFSIPFLVTGNIIEYGRSVFVPGMLPDYQTPLMYAFNGGSALLTFFHLEYGWDTSDYFVYYIPALIIAVIACLYLSYRRNISVSRAALAGFLIFICFNYRINYQYLVIYIPLALWVASVTRYRSERIIGIIMAVLPAVWVWLFNDAFWFYFAQPEHLEVVPLLERLGMYVQDMPDRSYVIFAMVLMGVYLTYIVLTFTKWGKKPEDYNELLMPLSENRNTLAGTRESR